jgi:hypothetical protein
MIRIDRHCSVTSFGAVGLEGRVWHGVPDIVNRPELIYRALEDHDHATNGQCRWDDEVLDSIAADLLNLKKDAGKLHELLIECVIEPSISYDSL